MSAAVASPEKSKALTVLKETINPPPAFAVQSTGARLVSILKSTGWNYSNRQLTADQIIRLPGVIICLDVLAQDIAKTPLKLYEKLPNNGKREVPPEEHWMALLLSTEPNRFHTWYEFIEMLMLHLGVVQNAFVAKRMNAVSGKTTELIPVMPARVTHLVVEPEQDPVSGMGFFCYRVDRNTSAEKVMFAKLPNVFLQDEFIHLRGRMFDGLTGYSNLDAGARMFGLADELTAYQTKLFGSDGQMPGVFQKPGEAGDSLSEDAFDRLRAQLAEASRKFREESKPIVLEEGLTFQQIAMNAEQAQLKEARDAALVDTARLFRIPPHKIMHLVNVKYENMETLEKSYVNDTLIPYCQRLEQRFGLALLTREDRSKYFFEFDRRAMLLNDMQKQAEFAKVGAQVGALELDEFRALFGYNELPGGAGKTRLIPSTYNLVDENNEVVIPAGAQPQGDGSKDAEDGADAKKEAE